MITLTDLCFSYTSKSRPIFRDFNLSIAKGEAWAVIGPSGCGKSTLLSLLAGLIRPDKGEIAIRNTPIDRPRPETGLVLQDHGLLPWSTTEKNIALGLTIRSFYKADGRHVPKSWTRDIPRDQAAVTRWMERLGLLELRHQYPQQLSRGQRQRAAIARSLVMDPDLLLMDEPFSALDPPIREELQGVMHTLHAETRITSLTVTHDIAEAVILGERILLLTPQTNTMATVMENPVAKAASPKAHPEFSATCHAIRTALGGGI